ncbi:Spy/CpxP family protein refolding chaperone [Flavivirga jejuensis]|uniref:Heavy-metal resistance protein n=1 Tax=Flavivirga jejuensis TaxID=870487 RepID=A0ABT8WMC3_9FLAO|nr:hypothetical protein [Flavivirga jejuensis]MDO5974185.1 hypothetical protein [Flavivirga jejuensis]
MKKNVLLYILLVFLIVVNGFFLFNYIGNSDKIDNKERPKGPANFIVKQLNFDDEQMQQFEEINKKHHQQMRRISDNNKKLKDALFNRISDISLKENTVDSITTLIGEKEKEKGEVIFYHFKSIQALCNDKQKKKFKRIINDALHKGDKPEGRPEGRREGRPEGRHGEPPPPRH